VAAVSEPSLRLASSTGRTALVATVLASALASLDATIVNVALPEIGADLDTDVSGLQWVSTSYLITLASLILLGGALGDRFGRRRVFVVGIVWFTVASAACGLAPNVETLVAGRLLQGVGGALVAPGSLALIQASFHRDDRAAAVGSWSALGGVAGALGPFLGGWVVDGPGWRWAFLLNIPLAGLALVATRAVPESSDPDATRGFDVAGAALAVATLAGITWTLISAGERGWDDPVAIAPGLAGAVTAAVFVRIQRRSRHPLVPPRLFASRTFTVLNLATFTLYAALGTLFFLVVYQLQVALGWRALSAGSALLPATLIMLLGSTRSGRLAERIGPRPQLVVGPLLVAAGFVVLSGIEPGSSWVTGVLPGAVVVGLGLVTLVAPLTASVMGSVDDAHVGTASAVNNAVARTAGLAAVALVPVLAGLTAARGPAETTDAFRTAMWISAGVAVVSAVVSALWLPPRARCRRPDGEVHCAVDGTPLRGDAVPSPR